MQRFESQGVKQVQLVSRRHHRPLRPANRVPVAHHALGYIATGEGASSRCRSCAVRLLGLAWIAGGMTCFEH